jgi:hypothetical protein
VARRAHGLTFAAPCAFIGPRASQASWGGTQGPLRNAAFLRYTGSLCKAGIPRVFANRLFRPCAALRGPLQLIQLPQKKSSDGTRLPSDGTRLLKLFPTPL